MDQRLLRVVSSLGRWWFRHPRVGLAILAALTLALAAALPSLELRTDGSALHPRGHPAAERTFRDRQLFADPEELILLLTSRPGGPALTSAAGLRALSDVHAEVGSLPGVQARGVRSAASLVDVAASGVASLGTFLEEVPEAGPARAALLRRMRESPWTDGLFLSADGRAAAIYAPLEAGPDRRARVEEVERWVRARDEPHFDLLMAGPVVAETLLGERILADLGRLVPIMVLVVALLLWIGLGTPGGVVVAMGKTLVVLVWTGGLMALAGVPVTLVTTILPVLLMALCVTDEVHVVTRLQRRLARSARLSEGREGALVSTLAELHRPVVYTSISTAIGFLSFLGASIAPLRQFGALAAVGILLAMLMTFTLTPSLVAVLPASWFVRRSPAGGGSRTPRTAFLAGRRRSAAFVIGLLLLLAGAPGFLRLTVQDSWIANFDPASPLVRAEREFNARFWGTYRFDVVFSGAPGLFHRPEGVALLAAASRAGATAPHARGVVGPLQPLDTVAELLGLSGDAAALPADALEAVFEVAAQYPRHTALRRLVTADGHAARLSILVNSADYRRASALADHVDREMARLVEGTGVAFHVSGDVPLAVATVGAIVRDQLRSIAWTLAGVGLLLLLVNRSPWLTLVQLVPPAAAAWLILSGMGYAGVPLGIATSMFAALTLGIGIDLALHVTCAYGHQRSRGLEAAKAVAVAFEETARGRRWSTAVLSLGFLVLTASAFAPNHHLGILLCAAMLASYLTTSLFVPWMLAR